MFRQKFQEKAEEISIKCAVINTKKNQPTKKNP